MALDESFHNKVSTGLYEAELLLERRTNRGMLHSSVSFPTSKSLQILDLLSKSGNRRIVYSVPIGQADLARKLRITRQALSLHFKKLRESGFVQIGRGFVNVTEEGLRAIGCRKDPVFVTVRILPQRRAEAIEKISKLPAIEIFRVAGDADAVLVVEQDKLDHVLEILSGIDGVVETRSLVSMPCR